MSSVQWVLGIDPGKNKTGVAIGQSLTATARPLGIIHLPLSELRAKDFSAYITEWHPEVIVAGMPELADGTPHPLSHDITSLVQELKATFHLPIYLHSEFLSSHEARQRDKKSRYIDDLAAVVILESWLDMYYGSG